MKNPHFKLRMLIIFSLLFVFAALAEAFSVDVDYFSYQDPKRQISYDFSAGTQDTVANGIILPESAIIQKDPLDTGFMFGSPPDLGSVTITLDTTAGVGAIQTSTGGGVILTGSSEGELPVPSSSWTWNVTLKNFAGITESGTDYRFYAGSTAPVAPGPKPFIQGIWNSEGRLELQPMIYDRGTDTVVWASSAPVVFEGLVPATTTLELRIENNSGESGTVVFSYKCNDGALTQADTYAIPSGMIFQSLPAYFPVISLGQGNGGGASGGENRELIALGHPPKGFRFATNEIADGDGDFLITGFEGNEPPYSSYGFLDTGVTIQNLGFGPFDPMTNIPTTGYETLVALSLTEGYSYAFRLADGSYGLLYVKSVTPTPPLGVYAITMVFDYQYQPGSTPAGISFTGMVKDSMGAGIEGATVFMAGNPSLFTTTVTGGAFTLEGLPVDTAFTLSIAKMGYAPVFSAVIRSGADIENTNIPFILFTPPEVAAWGIESGKGVITGRVWDPSLGSGIQNAEVFCTSMLGQTYTPVYPGSGTAATAEGGRYLIPNVVEGDMVAVTAQLPAFVFDGRVFMTHGDAISEGYIFSSSDGDTLALRGAFDAAMVEFNAKNLSGFMAYVSENYRDDGLTKAGFAAELTEEFNDPEFQGETYTVLNTVIDGTSATMMVLWNGTDAELLHFVNESGAWKLYGNQKLFEVMARSGYQAQSANPDIYWVSLEVEDPGNLIASVTVTGDGIDGSIALYHDTEEQEWYSWSESPEQTDNNPKFGNTRPALPLSYTFTIEYGSGQQATETVAVNHFAEVSPTNLSPAQDATVTGGLAFSWTPVPGFSHGLELFDSTWNQIWSAYDLQSATVAYDGPALADGTYSYIISSDDPEGNYSLLQTSFTYQATAAALTPDVMYMRLIEGYKLELGLEGEVTGIASVTVTGPANSGIVDFPLNGDYDEFWGTYPSDTTFITESEGFPENYAGTYTFTVTYTDQHTETFTYDFQPGTPGALPADVTVNAAGILSWGPNTAVDHYYYILYDSDGFVIRNAEGTQYADGVTINLYSLLGGYRDETGTYFAQVVAVYGGGDETYSDKVAFSYNQGDNTRGYVIGGVYCQGWTQASGAMHVVVYSDEAMQTPVAGLEEVFNENPAEFLIFGLAPGVDYYVGAYLDSNGNNQYDEGEPFAAAPYNPVQVTEPSQTNAGGINLVAGGPAGVSFSGWVRDTQEQAVTGAQVEAWRLASIGGVPAPERIGTVAADGALGAFTLTDLPAGEMFYLSIPTPEGANYAPVLSRYMLLGENVQALLPYRLFTDAEYAAFANEAGTGIILGRVAMRDDPSQPLAGATVTVQRWTPDQLYPDRFYAEVISDENGMYVVRNVPLTDDLPQYVLYQVTASLDGYDFQFNNSVVPVAADTVTEDSFSATEAGLQAGMLYMRSTGGDQLEMMLRGDITNITSVTVTGPGSSGILNFLLNPGIGEDEGEFWAVYPSDTTFITEGFPENFAGWYTFIATYNDSSTKTLTIDFQPGTPLEVPANAGVDGATGMLAWDAVDGAAGYYLIIWNADSQMEVYNGEDQPPITGTSFPLFTAMGQQSAPAGDYTVQVVAVDGPFGNEAYADPTPFSYQGGAGTTTISFTGRVVDSEGSPLEGAEVNWADNPVSTETETDGTFIITGLPVDGPFTLHIWMGGYVDVYSAVMRSGADIDSTGNPFKLFTPAQVEAWGVEAGKGVITGRVLDRTSTSGFAVPNAVVSCTSLYGQPYTVAYPGGAEATGAEGTYMILNVADGDRVIVTATCPGFAFDGRVFMAHADSVSEGIISGASDGATLALRTTFDAAMAEFNAKNLSGFMAYVSESYLDDGQNKAGFSAELEEEFSDPGFDGETYVVLGSFIDGEMGYLMVLWNSVEREVIPFKNEGGGWKLYGNQKLFEVMARSGHQAASVNPDTYWVSLEVEDPGDIITGVTVTGDGIDGSLALYHDTEEHRWNSWQENNTPTFGNMRPELPLTYTFTINYGSGQQATETVAVTNFVEVFPYDAAPWEGQTVTGDFAFSWTPIPGFSHGIELSDMNWNRIWEKYDLQGGLVDGQVQVVYDGPALEGGRYYYNVVTGDSDGNYSLLQTSFTYAPPGPVPSLGQAITVLKALTGQNPTGLEAVKDINNDGRIGLIEAMYVLQTNAGLVTPLPVTSESGTVELTSRAWNDNDGFDFSEATTKRVQIIDDMYDWQDTDFIVETNIIFLAPGVEAQDLGEMSLSDVNRVPIDGYGPTLDVILDPAHVYAFRLFDGTYAAIQFTETAVDQGNDTFKSTFNYKYQPNWSANF